MITITEPAKAYLRKLVAKPENKDKALRLKAMDPNTPYAEACLEFIIIGPENTQDFLFSFEGFSLYVDHRSLKYLEEAKIDLNTEGLSEELVIETPNLQPINMLPEDASLEERVHYLLEMEINPSLAAHGGMVRLVEITNDNVAILQFGGGCQGCGMADVTLKQGIERTLLERIPEIKAVKDVTEHHLGKNPYF